MTTEPQQNPAATPGASGPTGPQPDVAPPQGPESRRPGRWSLVAGVAAVALVSGGLGAGVTYAVLDDGAPAVAEAPVQGSVVRSSDQLEPGEGSAASAAQIIGPSVVTIVATGQSGGGPGPFRGAADRESSATGSGVVIRADGYVLTNNHVVELAADGGTLLVTFADGTSAAAELVGTDPSSDLAVIKVDTDAELVPATFADSDDLVIGQPVIAVGAPLGLSNTVTEGIVSTVDRPVRTGEGGDSQAVIDAVQTDAAINPGNSGGPLVDLAGRVVGINTAIATAGDAGSIGVGFAIAADDAAEVADELIAGGVAVHPQLGVSVADVQRRDATQALGAEVAEVVAGGPAEEAGLREGDVITAVDDRTVTDADTLIVAIRAYDPGDRVTLTYVRDGRTATTEATLTQR